MFLRLKKIVKQVLLRILGENRIVIKPINNPILMTNALKGRRAFITGGGKGIGRAIALAYADAGADVIICGRNEIDLSAVARERNGKIKYLVLDMMNVDRFQTVIAETIDRYGMVDILVNNAAKTGGSSFGESNPQEFDEIMSTNLKAPFFIAQEFVRIWKSKSVFANILNICSASSLRPGETPYMISKAAIKSMTVGMARKCIKYGIVVNGLAPGVTSIPRRCPDINHGINWECNPSGRHVTPEEIANMAVCLVSDMGKMVVGDVLYVTGGAGIITFDDV